MIPHDTIIVGAGAAGCVLAARLTEDPSHRVLLLEAGPDYADQDLPPEIRYGYGPHGIYTITHDWGLDHNRPGSTGVGPLPLNNRERIRQSASLCYLDPARGRSNLAILSGVRVTRILFEGTRAVGVEGVADGQPVSHYADQVILSAGAIGTPHLMLLSGLGPADDIASHGVPAVADIPGVGRNLRDHPAVPVIWDLAPDLAVDETTHYHQVGLRYTAGGSPDVNDMIVYATALPDTRRFLARPTVNLARSAGTVSLASRNPGTPPRIDLNYFDHSDDRSRMRESIRFLLRLGGSEQMRGVLAGLVQPELGHPESDTALDTFILSQAATGHHASATCRMGPPDEPMAVVDPQGCVRGIDNLRIVDASIMPDCVRANIQATVLMMAERIADWIGAG